MTILELVRKEIEEQQSRTKQLREKPISFPVRVELSIEEDRLRNMLCAQEIAATLAERSIQNRNHLMFQDLRKLFPETYEFCKYKVTHL